MYLFTDQLGREVALPHWPPRRIVSLVPSQTELLFDLGLGERVVGITKFCVHPAEWFQKKTRVGGTKTVNLTKIETLQPDLIIGNKEENERGQIETLAQRYPVWLSDVSTLPGALDMMLRLGALTGAEEAANNLVRAVQAEFDRLGEPAPPVRVAYLIWRKPFMVAGSGTFIDDMLQRSGFFNAFAGTARYPEVSAEALAEAGPRQIFLSSEPYPFAEKHLAAFKSICPDAEVRVVDGELFSWYGSRLLRAPEYFLRLRKAIFDQK